MEGDIDFDEMMGRVREFRYGILFGDLHARSLNYFRMQQAWDTEL